MENHFGVFRTGEFMREGIAKLDDLRARVENVALADRSNAFNTSRIECLELQTLDTRGVKCIRSICQRDIFDSRPQIVQLGDPFTHEFPGSEHTEVILHALL